MSVDYGNVHALEGIDLHFHCGELTAIVGPNGGGKSTLLKALLGDVPYRGEVHFRPRGKKEKRPRIGYVPQKVNIPADSPMSVLDLLAVSRSQFPTWFRIPSSLRRKAHESLSMVSADSLINRKIGELSGGELQRVLLASAMNPLPEILLLDEPVSGVDVKGLSLFYETICDLRRNFDISIILVTHDLAAIAPHADRMILVNKRIVAEGKPQTLLSDPECIALMGSALYDADHIPVDAGLHGRKS
ncbi:MAG TPA: metal ABC transporter ATP-binding protein [Candidatus Paceibacterota bacterium]